MIANYWTLAIITIFYFVWCEVRADQRSNKLNKLEFWKREPINDTRRQHKKQTRNDKYPRTFQAVDVNELNQIISYDEAHTDEINKNKDENLQNGRILLSGSNKNNPSSPIVWQNYVTDDKFKNKKEINLKHTRNHQDNTEGTENKNNFAIDHIHFKKYRYTENLRRDNEDSAISNRLRPLSWTKLSVIKYI
ncbi:unnamed protein product [Arctia plantaginis]|uniref:Uncharacterized protein n=1 Tax=Arctia plantaginis TaxID=874455 RepID=A0A8S1B5L5_ARCPL|nr:unnamed protein product [Arctia plantaginis]